ncbi:3-deoxy-7-phosphoheptulonate synthase, partial [Clostridium sporogenes]
MEKLLVDRKNGKDIIVKVGDIVIGREEKVIISGPCAVEDEKTVMSIAGSLKKLGVHMLRGGAFKPRTSPYSFQGLKFEGL